MPNQDNRWNSCKLKMNDFLKTIVNFGLVGFIVWQFVQFLITALGKCRSKHRLRWPGPKKHWLTGNISIFRTKPENLHHRLFDLHQRFGKIVHMRFGPVFGGFDIFSVADPELVQAVMKSKDYGLSVLAKRMFTRTLGQYSLVQLEGDLWKRHRRLVSPVFSTNRMKHVAEAASKQTLALVSKWRALPCGSSVECNSAMRNLTLDIFGWVGFGYDFDVQNNPDGLTAQAINDVLDHISDIATHPCAFLWPLLHPVLHFKISKQREVLSNLVNTIITQRRQDVHSTRQKYDMLSQFLLATDPDSDVKHKLTQEEVHDEIITFIFGGFETTSSALSWFLYLMARNPAVQRRAQEELDSKLNTAVLPTQYKNLPYLSNCIKESLRFIPPANSFVRGTCEDTQLGGHFIPKGSAILLNTYCLHHSPENWTDPDSFDPSRWESKSVGNKPFVYTPFGGGTRRCVGQSLAICEMKTILALLLKHFSFTLDLSRPVTMQQKITLAPLRLNLFVTYREPPM